MAGMGAVREVAFAIVRARLDDLHPTLARLFTDPWVASYQIGFGPPLVRASDRLIQRTKQAKSAIEKLAAYIDCCLLEETERVRLAGLFRRLVVRQLGAVEAESLDEKSADALDLSLRLHRPAEAPPPVVLEMAKEGILETAYPVKLPPEALTGRFRVKLTDPKNTRLLHLDVVRAVAADPETALAIELRVPITARALFQAFLARHARADAIRVVEIGDPVSHAKTGGNGTTS
jgi:hypothetical protein